MSAESCLNEVAIGGGRVQQALIAHYNEGDAVGELPVLVLALLVHIECPVEEGIVYRYDGRVLLGVLRLPIKETFESSFSHLKVG